MMRWSVLVVLLIVVQLASGGKKGKLYDFEDSTDKNDFKTDAQSTKQDSSMFSKGGTNSLLWSWSIGTSPKLTLDLGANALHDTAALLRGGMKFWMYSKCSDRNNKLQIIFKGLSRAETLHETSPVDANLDFTGWRGVWIGFQEFGTSSTGLIQLDKVEFSFSQAVQKCQHLYIDLLQVVDKISKISRDKIVSNVGPNDYSLHDNKDFWQQTLRWSNFNVPQPSRNDGAEIQTKIEDIEEIENRLDNWYADTGKGLFSDGKEDSTRTEFEEIRMERWKSLLLSVDKAANNYDKLSLSADGTKIVGPPLFPKVSSFGQKEIITGEKNKFGSIMSQIILPLALEYNLRSRRREVTDIPEKECQNLISKQTAVLINTAGANTNMRTFLSNELEKLPNDFRCTNQTHLAKLVEAIQNLNKERLRRLKLLLAYVEEQGWTYGSAVGSLDHEMNKNGAGYMHAIFLLRKPLREDMKTLRKLIKSMKWYNDFNEIYQTDSNYVYDGTTTDRMRTILLYRLMTILMLPSKKKTLGHNRNKRKIRDMRYYKTWVEHALNINKGLGGIIKPDYTGFHHKIFYGSAYTPHALHNAAFVQYLLDGTKFELNAEAKYRLRSALEVLRTVAVKYSTPNGICGRFPSYSRAVLAETLPAYAYISYRHSVKNPNLAPPTLYEPGMFLRLYDITQPDVNSYLKKGGMISHIFYLNSVGSLDIMEKIKIMAENANPKLKEEDSPSGHWSKNFAALSIHRRNNWTVAAKGFNHYVWDFESGGEENMFGLFQSHGSLQISNSEPDLKSYDVNLGWDWTKIPGTTSIALTLDDMILNKARYYNPKGFAGGVSLRGASNETPQNGAFGMDFENPDYQFEKKKKKDKKNKNKKENTQNSALQDVSKFTFKKSFFFVDDLIVCVGSGIKVTSTQPSAPLSQTTLFQDKKLDQETSIKVASSKQELITDYDYSTSHRAALPDSFDLKDTHGNTYRIFKKNDLHVTIKEQTSKTHKGTTSEGRYATAWLQHSDCTAGCKYRYGILIKGGNDYLLDTFSVKQDNDKAHIVQFDNLRNRGTKTTGYSIFQGNEELTDGPVSKASKPCMIMTEETPSNDGTSPILHIALSNPVFEFEDDPVMKTRDSCKETVQQASGYPKSSKQVGAYLMFCARVKSTNVKLTLRDAVAVASRNGSMSPVDIDGNESKTVVTFKNVANGFTAEAVFNVLRKGG